MQERTDRLSPSDAALELADSKAAGAEAHRRTSSPKDVASPPARDEDAFAMPKPLEYEKPATARRRLNFGVACIAGVVAGAVTFGSIFIVGTVLYVGVGLVAGIVLSAVAAQASPGFEFRAGVVGSAVAAAVVTLSGFLFHALLGMAFSPAPRFAAVAFVLIGAWFALPGLLGALWAWEGRRTRTSDEDPPAE